MTSLTWLTVERMDRLHIDRSYLDEHFLSRILREFAWPANYELESDLPDGILMRFPRFNVLSSEGPQSEMQASFVPNDTKYPVNLTLGHALLVLVPEPERGGKPLTPSLIDDVSIHASLPKVENGIRDLWKILLHHLQPCISQDFSWVPKYKAMMDALPD